MDPPPPPQGSKVSELSFFPRRREGRGSGKSSLSQSPDKRLHSKSPGRRFRSIERSVDVSAGLPHVDGASSNAPSHRSRPGARFEADRQCVECVPDIVLHPAVGEQPPAQPKEVERPPPPPATDKVHLAPQQPRARKPICLREVNRSLLAAGITKNPNVKRDPSPSDSSSAAVAAASDSVRAAEDKDTQGRQAATEVLLRQYQILCEKKGAGSRIFPAGSDLRMENSSPIRVFCGTW